MGDLRARRDELLQEMRDIYYWHVHRQDNGKNEPRWRGVRIMKFPTDLILYAEVIFENKPDWIIECGTAYGGSALFFGDMLSLIGNGHVITIDIEDRPRKSHSRVEQIIGNSVERSLVQDIRNKISGKIMVILDSEHSKKHVSRELRLYTPLVTKGQYCVVEDCYWKNEKPLSSYDALQNFLLKTDKFRIEFLENKYLFAMTRNGWLRRI